MIQTYLLDSSVLADPFEAGFAMHGISKCRIEKIRRIKHPGARKQSFGAALLEKYVLERLAPEANIHTNGYGKPVCAGIPFNLSHTKDAVILSVWESTDGVPQDFRHLGALPADVCLGCDIERARQYEPHIARRFFTEAEYESLEAAGSKEAQAELFYRYWTKKESVMKLTGLGMSLPMDLYDVRGSQVVLDTKKAMSWYGKSRRQEQKKPEFTQAAEVFLHHRLFLKEYRYEEYCITVCSIFEQFAPEILLMDFEGRQYEPLLGKGV
ncbi:MAG: 4'-phosphopantetheinyl transferase superfamily protein [Eubacterium sp.]|nr:4'-phosphopantetheinyl transferase superfamily protein [Eubacterium sp.]